MAEQSLHSDAEKCPAATIPNNFSSYLTIYLLP